MEKNYKVKLPNDEVYYFDNVEQAFKFIKMMYQKFQHGTFKMFEYNIYREAFECCLFYDYDMERN